MNLRDAAQQAERVLYKSRRLVAEDGASALLVEYIEVLNNLRSALAQQAEQEQAEPVAWMYTGIKRDGTEHGPHLVWQPEYMDAMSAEKGAKATPLYVAPPKRKPLTDEQDRALCEAYYNNASDEYFKARPALDCREMRQIFYAGHRKAWISYEAAHGIGEKE